MTSLDYADTIFQAAVVTFDPRLPAARAVAVTDGVIVAVGDDLGDWEGPNTSIVDFGDAALLPGLTDCHIHPIWGITGLAKGTDLTDVATMDEVIALLAQATPLGPDEWLLGWGLDPNIFDGPMTGRPFRDPLGDRPMYLRLRDAHSAVASPRAIELAGITGAETFPDKSYVELDPDGAPSGLLLELSAMALMDPVLPQFDFEQNVAAVRRQLEIMASTGLTGGHVMDFAEGSREILEAIEADGELPIRLRLSPMCTPDLDRGQWQELRDIQGTGGRRWTVEGIKFMIDGTIDNGTAWLEQPDLYGENEESMWTDPDMYADALHFYMRDGVPTATHAIGDGGVRHVLRAIERSGEARHLAPHRIEHIETVPDETVHEFARLGVIASMQPVHCTHHTRADRSDNWSVRLGEVRASRGWRCRDLRELGVTLALGSDWPVTPSDPRAMMADAQLRRPVARPSVQPIQPEQGLTALMAYEGYTTHAAAAVGHQEIEGAVRVGLRADFTILEANPLTLGPEEQADNTVHATVIGGVVQYDGRE